MAATGAANCADGDVVSIGANISGGGFTVACSLTLDLSGRNITTNGTIGIAGGRTLTITDSVGGGSIDASTSSGPGISTSGATLVVNAGRITVDGGQNSAAIGGGGLGAGGTVTIEGTADVTARGGAIGGAGIGGGFGGAGGTVTIRGNATVLATGESSAAGIGGGSNGASGTVSISGNATVTASADAGAALGGGAGQPSSGVTISGDATVTATSVMGAAIGGGQGAAGGPITISGGTVTATALGNPNGEGPSAIGGGNRGAGGTVTISGDAVVTATGSRLAAAIGGGRVANGGDLTISDSADVTVFGGTAVGNAAENNKTFGSLILSGTLRLGNATTGTSLLINNSTGGDEVSILSGGRIVGGAPGTDGSAPGTIEGTGSIANAGAITLASTSVSGGVPIKGQHYALSFDSRGGSAVGTVRVFAASLQAGSRALPTPTRAGFTFEGWNSAADGSGTTLTTTTTLPGSSTDGTAVALTYYAQWTQVPVAPSITGAATALGRVGTPFTYTPTVAGAPAPTITTTSALPPGVTLDPGTGALTGTPTAAGTFPVTLSASNASGTATLDVTLTVEEIPVPPTLTGPGTATGTVGSPFTYTPTSLAGTPAPHVQVQSGTLPPGLSVADATGIISGTPTTAGTFAVTLVAINGQTPSATLPITLTIEPAPAAPTISGAATANAAVGVPFTYTPTVGGHPAPTVTTTSALPPGLTLAAGTGVLSGTPTTPGTYPVTLTAANASGSADLGLVVTVVRPAGITGPATATGTVGTPFTYTPTVTGTGPVQVTSTALPPGLSLSPSTGTISGTPSRAGTTSLTLTASNSAGEDDLTVSITIAAAPRAACGDGKDNDGNGAADFPQDLGCTSASDTTEAAPATATRCGTARPITGTGRNDTLRGTARADTLTGLAGKDLLDAKAGNDCVYGGTGDDRIDAGSGDDRINAQAGKDTVDAGVGADYIVAADGTKETIDCGGGTDTVIADRTDILRGCENRVVAPSGRPAESSHHRVRAWWRAAGGSWGF
ncbi:putative Ig domain-containing protein [Nocardioides sp.]|uniref:putative Ig domain-containing protein n=1 Tax=Nocardioides sp. TaxID=35761 RepID=UPI0035165DB2